MIKLKNEDQLAKMRSAGHLLYDVLCRVKEQIAPGMTTMDLNNITDTLIRKAHAIPTEYHYEGYPASVCASIDDEVIHGIPSKKRLLKEGMIISLDVTLALDGWQADSAFTAPVGDISDEKRKLIRVTEECFEQGARQAVNNNHIGDITHAVQTHAEANGFNALREYTGHGIGKDMHEDPSVPNCGMLPGHGCRLRPGMTFCIEPMIVSGAYPFHVLDDGWTVVTNDHRPAAHYEHTVSINESGYPELLTFPGHVWKETEP